MKIISLCGPALRNLTVFNILCVNENFNSLTMSEEQPFEAFTHIRSRVKESDKYCVKD